MLQRAESGQSHALPLCSQDPTVTHKDVKEGSFEVVVDDLLLQVLPNTCVRLEEGMRTALGAEPGPWAGLTSRDGEQAGAGWGVAE